MIETAIALGAAAIPEGLPIVATIALCAVLLLAAVYLPGLSDLLKTENPTRPGWLVVLSLSLVPFVFDQALRSIQKRKHK